MRGNPRYHMKTIFRFSVLLVLAVASQAMAAFESVKPSRDNLSPEFPPTMISDGVTEGQVVFALSVSAEGKLSDSLVLAYTHEAFVRTCREAMAGWKFTPARLDGENVPVQIEVTVNFKREGFVETSSINIVNNFLFGRLLGQGERLKYRLPRSNELDRKPVVASKVDPQYAQQAEKDGVRGKVVVHFYIDEKGAVRMPSVSMNADPYLSDVAVSALRGWQFQPAMRRGEPVMVAAVQEFNFGRAK